MTNKQIEWITTFLNNKYTNNKLWIDNNTNYNVISKINLGDADSIKLIIKNLIAMDFNNDNKAIEEMITKIINY